MILGYPLHELALLVGISLAVCVTVCTLAMEASVLFVPAFLFFFPRLIGGFPDLTPNEAIGLAITVEFFGYTSSVAGYWLRGQVDLRTAGRALALTAPLAVVGRVAAYLMPTAGLLLVFGLLLLALAVVLWRAHAGRDAPPHTCLLCGDSLAGMAGRDDPGVGPGNPGRTAAPSNPGPTAAGRRLRFSLLDRAILGVGGAAAGLVGIAVGEVTNTFLSVRKRVPLKRATGTAALVLHLTILAALAANLAILALDPPALEAERIVIPWKVAAILAPTVVAGGQIGSFINSRLPDRLLLRALTVAYTVVGLFVLARTLLG